MEDALPYNNPEQLIYYLRTTHKGTNNQEIKNATEVLYAMSKDIVRFTDSLMYLIMNNENNGRNSSLIFKWNKHLFRRNY